MKKQREFLSELYKIRIKKLPFIEYFQKNKDLRNKLFAEYLKTELQPNLNLYVNKYFTDKEIQNKIEANEKRPESKVEDKNIIVAAPFYYHSKFESRLSKIKDEFYEKKRKKSLDEKYKSHQLDKTEIFKKLTLVDQQIEDFKDKVLNEKLDLNAKVTFSDKYTKDIIGTLEEIGIIELTKLVLNDFINDNENIKLELEILFDSAQKQLEKDYRELKTYANDNIKEYLKDFDKCNNESQELTKEQLLKEDNNLISKVDIEDVYNYFEILITSRNKNDEFYLTEKQLLTFIKASFIDLKPIPQYFNGEPKYKKDIRSLFFRFYDQCSKHEYNETNKKDKYFNLMFKAFYGFDKIKDHEAWSKTNQKLIGKKITNRPKN